jgi:hypothetical protein
MTMTDNTKEQLKAQVLDIIQEIESGEFEDMDGEINDSPVDYLDGHREALDIEYMVSENGHLNGAIITVAIGGPTIWIDTKHNKVVGCWGTDKIEMSYHNDGLGLDDLMQEHFEATM